MGQTVIEINGVKYDARSGGVVTHSPTPVAPKQSGHNIDGIVSNPKPHSVNHTSPATGFKPTIGRKVHDVTMLHHKHASKPKTLMRTAVKKPGHAHIAKTSVDETPSFIHQSSSYISMASTDIRLKRATEIPTNSTITRFNLSPSTKLEPTMTPMSVAVPQTHNTQIASSTPVQNTPAKHGASDFVNAQLAKNSNNDAESPFKKQPLHKRVSKSFKSNKLKSVAAGSLATLLIGGFIAYQSMPSISLALANRNAGITARIPKGVPSNFAISKTIDASKGQVTLSFISRTDDRRFSITQQTSNDMDSSGLEAVLASSHAKSYQSYDSNGIKLFITGPGSADWVDGNMRYNVSGNSGLSSEQLATIARSL